MPLENILARSLVSGLYGTALTHQRLNVGGALNDLASRERLSDSLDTLRDAPLGPTKGALQGALLMRDVFWPVTTLLKVGLGTGQTHYSPRELAEARQRRPGESQAVAQFKTDLFNLVHNNHAARLEWLTCRFDQTLEHPCDTGLLGVIVGITSLPQLFISSAVASVASIVIGGTGWAAQRLAGHKIGLIETISHGDSWFNNAPAYITPHLLPTLSAAFQMTTHFGPLCVDLSSLFTAYLVLQGARIAVAAVQLSLAGAGALLGLSVGLVAWGLRSVASAKAAAPLTPSCSSSPDRFSLVVKRAYHSTPPHLTLSRSKTF